MLRIRQSAVFVVLLISYLTIPSSSCFPASASHHCAGLIDAVSDLYNLEYITLDLNDGDAQLLLLVRRHLRKYVSFQSATKTHDESTTTVPTIKTVWT